MLVTICSLRLSILLLLLLKLNWNCFLVTQIQVEVYKNPNLGFSIAGGVGTISNPFHPNDHKVCRNLAAIVLVSGDKQKSGRAKDKGSVPPRLFFCCFARLH